LTSTQPDARSRSLASGRVRLDGQCTRTRTGTGTAQGRERGRQRMPARTPTLTRTRPDVELEVAASSPSSPLAKPETASQVAPPTARLYPCLAR
jgi:hypothetical protein